LRLSDRLDAVAATSDVLPAVVRTVAESLRLRYVAVELAGELAATSGRRGPGTLAAVPLTFQGEQLGRLLCETRAPGERFGPADLRALRELARHIAVAAREVMLTRDLLRSREQLIRAREEERRRLRRDLHDGVGPSLAGIALGLDSARRALRSDPAAAEQTLRELRRATQESVAEVRRLARDLRPPALDQFGLLGALREQAQRLGGDLELPAELPELPAAVEVAAYRIASEALTNAARHAGAGACRVRLSLNGGLRVEVDDDGIGVPDGYVAGVGIASMRERAEELGGGLRVERRAPSGTRVLATLPLEP
jgi:signal transduction histidine kinase